MHPRILFLLIWRRTSKSLFKGAEEGWPGAPGGSCNKYNDFEISVIVNAKKMTHIVLDVSLFVMSHTMLSVLHCTKPSFEHGFNGGWSAAQRSVVLTDSWSAWKIARIVSLPQSWLL